MLVLGLQGSPRVKGNSALLLDAFLDEATRLGARSELIQVAPRKAAPCQECGTCERKGYCPIDDAMQELYPRLWQADLIVMATPIFFYGPTAQLKALIDRSQALWARKYVLGLEDPGRKWRKGFLLAVGATKGKNLFEGAILTAKYFFDAVGAQFEGSLGYRRIEKMGDIKSHPTAMAEAVEKAGELITPLLNRKKIIFVGTENSCRSQMATAFARAYAGDRVESMGGGSSPALEVNPLMTAVMAEKGIDMAYLRPTAVEQALARGKPDLVVSMEGMDIAHAFPGVPVEAWELSEPGGQPIEFVREVRDTIEGQVLNLLKAV